MKSKLTIQWLLVCFGIAVLSLAAQVTNTNVIIIPPDVKPDVVPAIKSFLQPIQFLIVPLVTVLVQGFKVWIPRIPAGVWPWVAPLVGAGIDWAASKVGMWTGNMAAGALLGGLGSWFYSAAKPTGVWTWMSPTPDPIAADAPSVPPTK